MMMILTMMMIMMMITMLLFSSSTMFQTGMKTFRIGTGIWGNKNYQKISDTYTQNKILTIIQLKQGDFIYNRVTVPPLVSIRD